MIFREHIDLCPEASQNNAYRCSEGIGGWYLGMDYLIRLTQLIAIKIYLLTAILLS